MRRKKAQHLVGFESTTYPSRGVCSTASLQPLPLVHSSCPIVTILTRLYLGGTAETYGFGFNLKPLSLEDSITNLTTFTIVCDACPAILLNMFVAEIASILF